MKNHDLLMTLIIVAKEAKVVEVQMRREGLKLKFQGPKCIYISMKIHLTCNKMLIYL